MKALGYIALMFTWLFNLGCALENSLVYQPAKYPDGDWQPQGVIVEDAWFESADGTKLHGWYAPQFQPTAVVLIAHGNGGNLSGRWQMLRVLHDHCGAAVMVFDYRGYGRSEGSPDEAGVLADARAARKWLAERAGITEREIVLYGESLGGGVMVDLAARDGARGLVLQSTFTSLPDVAGKLFPYLPVSWLMTNRFESGNKIGLISDPILIAHGDQDRLIPLEDAKKLHALARQAPKKLVVIPGADHNWAWTPEYVAELKAFLSHLPNNVGPKTAGR